MTKNPFRFVLPGALLLIYFWSFAAFWSASFQKHFRPFFHPKDREVLAVAVGRVLPEESGIRVLKVRTPKGIAIEIYGPAEGGPQPLIDSVTISDFHDATTQFQARALNLALKDLDGDRVFEIIAPTFDSSLTPHLNIFRYNPSSKRLEPYVE